MVYGGNNEADGQKTRLSVLFVSKPSPVVYATKSKVPCTSFYIRKKFHLAPNSTQLLEPLKKPETFIQSSALTVQET